jgi:histidine triad (HIT) family protein
MKDCIFCKIIAGEIPSFKVWENNDYVAFLDRYPQSVGMTVLIPKKHYPGYFVDVPDKVLSELMTNGKEVAKILDSRLEEVIRTMLVFEGMDVDHIHLKLLPLYKGKPLVVTPTEPTIEELEKIHKKLI